jgi:hypothetical protein
MDMIVMPSPAARKTEPDRLRVVEQDHGIRLLPANGSKKIQRCRSIIRRVSAVHWQQPPVRSKGPDVYVGAVPMGAMAAGRAAASQADMTDLDWRNMGLAPASFASYSPRPGAA